MSSYSTQEDLAFAGLGAQAALLARGDVTSRELVEQALARIDAYSGLRAFRLVLPEAARASAAQADRRLAAGERAPLLGVPVAIKDDMDLAGCATAFGCAGDFEPKPDDGEVARRLKAAGAVVVGKTNTPEIGQWPFTEGAAFGITRNPWNRAHSPGGSSGGSAAAVAAAMVPAAVGSDGAGSVRIPAAWCHLVGIKPQRGRISTWPDPEAFNGLTCIGPLARSVEDAALLLDVLTGNHPGDLHAPPPPGAPFVAAARRAPGRLRIALSRRIPFSGPPTRLHASVRSQVERLAGVLTELGHEVIDAEPAYRLIGLTFVPRAQAGVRDWVARVPDADLLDDRTRANARIGRLLSGRILRAARALERPLARRIGRIFDRVDVILAPTTAKPPPPAGSLEGLTNWATDKLTVRACPMAWPWNVLGWPAISVPAGFTADGLPVGAQLMGRENDEETLISLAAQLEGIERWTAHRPALAPAG
ncbi:MAG TPA: amidase [Solirubrobacteraceae bacterium]|jgi:amidase|nr:amidase [Solirubrobacteraceae bacterium]